MQTLFGAIDAVLSASALSQSEKLNYNFYNITSILHNILFLFLFK